MGGSSAEHCWVDFCTQWTLIEKACLWFAGTPFEPSKRRAMVPLLYIQAVKWVAGIGFSAYCFWAVYNIDVSWLLDSRHPDTVVPLLICPPQTGAACRSPAGLPTCCG